MILSIITINYNNKQGLQNTINSVIAQTFHNYEWIIIDGDSNDGSKDVIQQNIEHFSTCIIEKDGGIYNAMNKGISHVHGDWTIFLNSGDMLYNQNTIESIFKQQYFCDVLYGDVLYKSANREFLNTFPNNLTLSYMLEMFICHQSTFFKSSLFSTYQYNETYKIVSDWLLEIELLLDNKKFEHLDMVVSICDCEGVSAENSERNTIERKLVYDKIIPFHLKHDLIFIKENKIFTKRKTFRLILNISNKFCSFLDVFFTKWEKIKKKTNNGQ